jgi:hypothetical protein
MESIGAEGILSYLIVTVASSQSLRQHGEVILILFFFEKRVNF